jgi:glycosyltransferase involved in cell wall biosynthesis
MFNTLKNLFLDFASSIRGTRANPLRAQSNVDRDFEFQPGPNPETTDLDVISAWVLVVHENNRGWILDAICREIGSRQPDTWRVVYNPPKLPPARNYFFSHYSIYLTQLRKNPVDLAESGTFVWYTHPPLDEPSLNIERQVTEFNSATRVIFTCRAHMDLWIGRGLAHEKACVVLGGADPNLFQSHSRDGGIVGLSSSFYERKNPDRLLEIVRLMPHRQFRLIGRNWEKYAKFEQLMQAPNFSYATIPYSDYPAEYATFDVFLSVSNREGGPIPLLEAMMCNAVPVASRTGFAPDLIRHGENGFLFDIEASAETIAFLIDRAFELDAHIRETVLCYSWDNFSRQIASLGR